MVFATVNDRYSADQIARYYAEGLWRDDTLPGIVRRQAEQRPDKVFLTDASTSCTYGDLHRSSLRLAAGLAGRGIGAGDRVAVQIPNWTEFGVIAVALSRIGAIMVPIMPIYRRDEVGYILASAGVKAAFTAGEFRKFDHAQMFAGLIGDPLESVFVVRGEPVPGTESYTSLFAGDTELVPELRPEPGPDDPFVIVFSSGTTSRPKGCLHTFNAMACGARLLGQGWHYSDADVQFGPSPVTHTTGLVTSILLPLVFGAGSHIMEIWEPRAGLERIAKFGCTGSVTATAFLQMLLSVYDPDVHDASSMRFWTSAGAPIPGSFIEAARRAIPNMAVLSLYGRTENVTTTMCTLDDDPARSVTSDGKALPGQEVRIVDSEGREVPRGQEGDISYRGSMNSLEYINQPEETAAMYTADGFSRSGDLGTMDADGYVRVTGRLKDIVIRGGLNISVRQVEDLLTARPEVGAVAVVGMPDETMGERVCCYLVPAAGAAALTLEQIRDYLLSAGLAIQKVPERLEIVTELPMTATGKIQKHLLRAEITARLKAEA
jgi:acyl-CoA synthetase (AMP-forming)/AMP-acid ligase II